MNRAFILLAAIGFLYPTFAHAQGAPEDHSAWLVCKADEDCVEIKLPCGTMAVNKQSQSDAQDYYLDHAYEALECKPVTPDRHRRIICDVQMPCDDSPTGLCPRKHGVCSILVPSKQ